MTSSEWGAHRSPDSVDREAYTRLKGGATNKEWRRYEERETGHASLVWTEDGREVQTRPCRKEELHT